MTDWTIPVIEQFDSERTETVARREPHACRPGGSLVIVDAKLAAGDVIVLDGAEDTGIARLGGETGAAAWCAVTGRI